MFLRHILTC